MMFQALRKSWNFTSDLAEVGAVQIDRLLGPGLVDRPRPDGGPTVAVAAHCGGFWRWLGAVGVAGARLKWRSPLDHPAAPRVDVVDGSHQSGYYSLESKVVGEEGGQR